MHPERIPSQAELLQIFRRAGFRAPTPLQERIIPLVLRGKNLAVQTVAGSGRTAAIVASLIIGVQGGRGRARGPASSSRRSAEVEEVSRTWTRFARAVREAPGLLPLGETLDVRREQRRLEKGGAVVVGTMERVIDHIRRGSLSFDALETVFVQTPDPVDVSAEAPAAEKGVGTWATPGAEREEFIRDAQFVFAKLPPHCQAVLFSRAPLDGQDELIGLLHRPTLLSEADLVGGSEGGAERGDLVVRLAGARSADTLAQVLIGGEFRAPVVLHSPRTDGQGLAAGLRRAMLRAEALPAAGALAARRRLYAGFAAPGDRRPRAPVPPERPAVTHRPG